MWWFSKCIYKSNYWRIETNFWNQENLRYLHISLKSKERNDRRNGTQIQSKVYDSTIIKRLKLLKFLSHIMTKQDWTGYLRQKLETALRKTNISYVISYKDKCLTNVRGFWLWFTRTQSPRRGWYLNYFTFFSNSKNWSL